MRSQQRHCRSTVLHLNRNHLSTLQQAWVGSSTVWGCHGDMWPLPKARLGGDSPCAREGECVGGHVDGVHLAHALRTDPQAAGVEARAQHHDTRAVVGDGFEIATAEGCSNLRAQRG